MDETPTGHVLEQVRLERLRQIGRWGPEHDDNHSIEEWFRLIADRVAGVGLSPSKTRRELIEVAALAVAAVESLDRAEARAT